MVWEDILFAASPVLSAMLGNQPTGESAEYIPGAASPAADAAANASPEQILQATLPILGLIPEKKPYATGTASPGAPHPNPGGNYDVGYRPIGSLPELGTVKPGTPYVGPVHQPGLNGGEGGYLPGPMAQPVPPGGLSGPSGPFTPPPQGFNPSQGWQQAMSMLPQYGGQQLTPNANLTRWGLFASQPGQQGQPRPAPTGTFQPPGPTPMPPPTLPPPMTFDQPTPSLMPPTAGTMNALPTYSGPTAGREGAYLSPDQINRPVDNYGTPKPGIVSAGGLAPGYRAPPNATGLNGPMLPALSDPAVIQKGSTPGLPRTGTAPSPTLSTATPSIAPQPTLSSVSASVAPSTGRTTGGLF